MTRRLVAEVAAELREDSRAAELREDSRAAELREDTTAAGLRDTPAVPPAPGAAGPGDPP